MNSSCKCFFLTGRTSTTDDGGEFDGSIEEIFGDLFIFQNKGETFSIDNEDLTEIIFDLCSLLEPFLLASNFTDFDIGLCGFLKAA